MLSLDLLLLVTHLKKPFLLSYTTLARFSSKWALAFCVFSLHIRTTALYSSFEAWPYFQWPYKFSFLLSSTKSSVKLVFYPTCLTYNAKDLSAPVFVKALLKTWPALMDPSKAGCQGTLLKSSMNSLKVFSTEIQSSNAGVIFSHCTEISTIKLNHFMITMGKTDT